MAYDEGLAQRIRDVLEDERGVTEKKMFGGLAFLVNGKMACGIIKDELMVQVGKEHLKKALARPHARPMDFTGKASPNAVFVAQAGLKTEKALAAWVAQGVANVRAKK
jgi:TfoX/Sxy family transcriptional regulator of competence genes